MNILIDVKIQEKLNSIISEEVLHEFLNANSIDFLNIPEGNFTYIIILDKTFTLMMEKSESNISITNISLGPAYVNTGVFTRELKK